MLPEVKRVSFLANEFHQLGIGHQAMIDAHGKRLGVCLWVFNHQVHLHQAKLEPPPAFSNLAGTGQRAAVNVQPDIIAKPSCLHNERVAVPVPDGLPHPAINGRFFRSSHADCAHGCVGIGEQNRVRALYNLEWIGDVVGARPPWHIALDFGVVGPAACEVFLLFGGGCPKVGNHATFNHPFARGQ